MIDPHEFIRQLEIKIDTIEKIKRGLQGEDYRVDSEVRELLQVAKARATEERLLSSQGKDTHGARFGVINACRAAISALKREEKLLIKEFETARSVEKLFEEIEYIEKKENY
jgi:hypothetical protein